MNVNSRPFTQAKGTAKKALRSMGYQVQRARQLQSEPTMSGALARAGLRGTAVAGVIDVGASTGIWSRLAMSQFPLAHYLLIEAQPVHAGALEFFASEHDNARVELTAAGPYNGTIRFDATDPFAGRASEAAGGPHSIEVPVATIDTLVERHDLPAPYCLKLDTHGFETPILRGALRTLAQTNLVVMECYNFRLPDALLFHEMCRHMGELGFRCIDLVDQMYRPGDLAFWQADLFFAPDSDPVFEHNEYA
jgi:FkbM family methyltransferase